MRAAWTRWAPCGPRPRSATTCSRSCSSSSTWRACSCSPGRWSSTTSAWPRSGRWSSSSGCWPSASCTPSRRGSSGGPSRLGRAAATHQVRLNWGRKYSLWVFNFGLACCAIEFIATSMARHDFIRLGVIPFAHGPRQADLLVVSGTLTDKMAPALQRLYQEMPEPKYVISFGSCSNCGGPYWDSYSVTKGVDQIIPVDVYVPGCPPRPEALLQGILKLQEKIARESLGERYATPPRPSTAALQSGLVKPPVADEAASPDRAVVGDGPAASEDGAA